MYAPAPLDQNDNLPPMLQSVSFEHKEESNIEKSLHDVDNVSTLTIESSTPARNFTAVVLSL